MCKKLLLVSLLLLPFLAIGETADDYFHRGAQYYVFGEKQKAKNEVETGLRLFPNDPELQKIAGLLKKEEEQKNQQQNQNGQGQQDKQQDKSQQQNQQKSQNKDQSQQQSSSQQQDKQKQEEQQREKQQQQSQSDKEKQQQEQQQQQADQNQQDQDKSPEEQQREAAMMAAGQMTPQQAKQLLDAQKNNDKVFQLAPPKKNQQQSRAYKDW